MLLKANGRQPLSRVLGWEPIRISARLKRAIWSSFAALPCGVIATVLSDSTVLFNAFGYVFAPGTMLAIRVVRIEESHRGIGVFLDILHWYGRAMSFALLVNTIFYALFIFGVASIVSGLKEKEQASPELLV